jgi:hypothetical protein
MQSFWNGIELQQINENMAFAKGLIAWKSLIESIILFLANHSFLLSPSGFN